MSIPKKSMELTEAMSNLINSQPFFASYLLDQMTISEVPETDTQIPTAATDGVNIIVNQGFFKGLTVQERVFVLAHEVMHGVFGHMQRNKSWADRGIGPDFKVWSHERSNHSQDYIINDLLKQAQVGQMPQVGLHDTNVGTSNDIWEDIYHRVPEPPKTPPNQKLDQHLPSPANAPSSQTTKTAVAQATATAKAMGNMPGELERIIGEILEPTKNWKELLRSALSEAIGHDESTWSKPNRRRLAMEPHLYFPGTVGTSTTAIAIVIDTSGSISDEVVNVFLAEVSGILEDARPRETVLYWTDSQVAGIDHIDDASDLLDVEAKGGGGTHMPAAYPVIEEEQDTSDLTCLVLTDGYTGWDEEPDFPVIVATTDAEGCPYASVEIKLDM